MADISSIKLLLRQIAKKYIRCKSLKVTSTTEIFFAIKQPLMCNYFFLFEEKTIFNSRDI